MIKIKHRVNSIDELKKLNINFGVEVDIRSQGSRLIISHDPFLKGILFKDWIKHYKHNLLILNVKEEGLERYLIDYMKDYNINDYFFLDQSFPFIIKYSSHCEKRSAIRFSEYEDINTCLNVNLICKWVWIDCFNKFLLSKKNYELLKSKKFKICLVSPELQGRFDKNEIKTILMNTKQNKFVIDAVCTKFPELWS